MSPSKGYFINEYADKSSKIVQSAQANTRNIQKPGEVADRQMRNSDAPFYNRERQPLAERN